ncbi:MAG: AsmA-like C-terminal domain-containing protein, partial [Candidatus Methylomirabilales bacterium]
EVEGEGSIDHPTIRGDYHLTALRYGTVPLGVGRGRVLLQDQKMTARLALPNQGYSILGSLQAISPYPYEVQVSMTEAELAPLFALTGSPLLQGGTGTGSGTAAVGGDLAPHRLTKLALNLHAPSLRIRGHTFHTAEPLRIDLREETLTISSVAVTGKTGWLNARGRIAFGGAVEVGVDGKIPLALALYYPRIIGGGTGTGEFDVKASGLWKAPRYTGWIKMAGGGFRLLDHPEPFQGIAGQVTFEDQKIHLPALEGRWAGGKVNVSGIASRGQGKGWRWAFDLLLDEARGERVFVRSEKDKRSVTGETSLWGTVTAGGSRWAELKQSLGGKLKLALKDGKILGFTVAANILRILNLTPDPVKGVPYDSLRATFELKQEVLETRNLTFVSDTIKIGGVGTIDLGRKEVDMLLAVQPLRTVDRVINALKLSRIPVLGRLLFGKERSVLVVAIKVEGPLDEPEVAPVPEESLGRGMFGIFRRLLELPTELAPDRKSSASK